MKNYPSHYLSSNMKPINVSQTPYQNQQGMPEPDICPVEFRTLGKMYGQIITLHEPNCPRKNQHGY